MLPRSQHLRLAALVVIGCLVAGIVLGGVYVTRGTRTGALEVAGATASASASGTPRANLSAAASNDPWDYCAAIGVVDRPDAKYLGDGTRAVIQDALAVAERLPQRFADPASRRVAIPWRCMGGAVWACDPGANLPCGPAKTSREPSEGMRAFCAESQQRNGVLPAFVSGHDTIFAWSCRDGAPVIDRQVFEVDERGFVARFWYRLDRPR